MRRIRWVLVGLAVAAAIGAAVRSARITGLHPEIVRERAIGSDDALAATPGSEPAPARPVPEFPRRDPAGWINSPPLQVASLRGKVVLLDVWTFG